MKKESDLNKPIGKMTRVDDFLPPPEDLVIPEHMVKVTLRIEEESLEFFKEQSKKHHTKYQKMIRDVLKRYAKKYAH